MADKIRSAELLVRTILSDQQLLADLRDKPEETLKKLSADIADELPSPLPPPSDTITNTIWLIIVISFSLVMVGSALVLGVGVFSTIPKDSGLISKPDTLLTVFTTVVGFLAGLISPSPMSRGGN